MTQGSMVMGGELGIKKVRTERRAPLLWRIRNALRPAFWYGWADNQAAKIFTGLTGMGCPSSL